MKRFLFLLIGSVLLCGLIAAWQFVFLDDAPALPETFAPRIAVWMGVTWSMDVYDAEALQALADDLITNGVTDAYVYVSYLKAGDFFNQTFDEASNFTSAMKQLAPDIRWWAWVGVPISITQPDGTAIANRLTDPAIRTQIADFAVLTIEELGFDGFHLNAERIPTEDVAFLQTLEEIREALPDEIPFSSTAHALRLDRPVTALPYPTRFSHWSPEYLAQAAQNVDEIAVMVYDSGLISPRDYRNWVAYQVSETVAALADSETDLIIGLPTTEEWTPTHQTQAEPFAVGLRGLQQGFSERVAGIALYAYWDTTADEWNDLRKVLPIP